MRVFAAIVPPELAHAHLDGFLASRREVEPALRWTPSHLWHITLAFMAEVPADRLGDLVDAISAATTDVTPIPVQLRGAGAFPDVTEARVMWVGVGSSAPGGLSDLERLALRTRTASTQAGTSPAGGTYRPHLTLARSRKALDATRWLRTVDPYAGPSWLADEVTVFVSRAHRSGRPHYEPEAVCRLGAVGPPVDNSVAR